MHLGTWKFIHHYRSQSFQLPPCYQNYQLISRGLSCRNSHLLLYLICSLRNLIIAYIWVSWVVSLLIKVRTPPFSLLTYDTLFKTSPLLLIQSIIEAQFQYPLHSPQTPLHHVLMFQAVLPLQSLPRVLTPPDSNHHLPTR